MQRVTRTCRKLEPFFSYPGEKLKETSPEYPRGFMKLFTDAGQLIGAPGENHVHTGDGNYVTEIKDICNIAGIEHKISIESEVKG